METMDRRAVLRGLAGVAAGLVGAGCSGNNEEVPVTAPDGPVGVREDDRAQSGDGDADGSSGDGGGTATDQRFVVPDYEFATDDRGDLVVVLTVRNRGPERHVGVVRVAVTVDDRTFAPERLVELDAGAEATFRIGFPVAREAFSDGGGFEISFEPGTPATPLPETPITRSPAGNETGGGTGTDATDT